MIFVDWEQILVWFQLDWKGYYFSFLLIYRTLKTESECDLGVRFYVDSSCSPNFIIDKQGMDHKSLLVPASHNGPWNRDRETLFILILYKYR